MAKKPEDTKQDEQNLEEYLRGDSTLSRAYRAEQKAQVPEHLDKAILLAANEAINEKQSSKVAYSPFARSWYIPVSIAAVLMLCVSLVFTIYKDSGQTLLTAPKSKFDIDARTVPVETAKSIGQGEAEAPEPEELELEKRPARKMSLRDKVMEKNDTLQSGITDKNSPKKDSSVQTLSDAPYSPERLDSSGRLESADVKQQKQIDADMLKNKSGKMELKANKDEADIGVSSAPALRYRQVEENLAKEKRIPKQESREEVTVDALVSPAGSLGAEMISAEQWLKQINDLWLSGDHQGAKESLKQFLVAYPDYPIDKIKIILDPETNLMDNIR